MLRHLHIDNLAVVQEASIEFGPGLNVLSGATGAGKSIVVDSMALLAGGRARADLIRTGEDLLTVTGVFDALESAARLVLEAAGADPGEAELVLRREISREGRNRIFLNDRPVTLRLLSELAPFLLRIHTQRQELGLVSPELQRFWVDRSGGEAARKKLDSVRGRFQNWQDLEARRQRLAGDERLRLERIDLLRFQRQEIDAAGLAAGEDVELRQRRDRLRHHEAIQQALGESFERLFESDGSALDAVSRSQRLIGEVESWEASAPEWNAELDEARIRIEEVAKSLRERLDAAPTDASELDAIEARLAAIDRLTRKYGERVDDILGHRERIAAELEDLEGSEEEREELESSVAAALAAYRDAAIDLSAARRGWAEDLAGSIEGELADLAMARARLWIDTAHQPNGESPLVVDGEPIDFGSDGIDRVTIMLQANPGQESGPLARVASGGELSRVCLALQLAAGETPAGRPTLIFDEVDSGVGGSEAAALGRKLRRLSDGGQILAVTHLPQVASCGHTHFAVRKNAGADSTHVTVEELSRKDRIEEIARMLSGEEITDTALSNAEELIEAAGVAS